jgi:hypothetical protein
LVTIICERSYLRFVSASPDGVTAFPTAFAVPMVASAATPTAPAPIETAVDPTATAAEPTAAAVVTTTQPLHANASNATIARSIFSP